MTAEGKEKKSFFPSASEGAACVLCSGMFSPFESCNADVLQVSIAVFTVRLLTAVKAEIIRFVPQWLVYVCFNGFLQILPPEKYMLKIH